MSANDKCPSHYTGEGEQHWDRCWRLYGRGYFVSSATKYAERYHKKNGLDDLKKAIHFLQKLCELEKAAADGTGPLGAEGMQPPLSWSIVSLQPQVSDEQRAEVEKAMLEYMENHPPIVQVPNYVFRGEGGTYSSTEATKRQWLDRMAGAGVRVRTPHENVHGYVVREGVMWCPHCGCPHDSFDPSEKGLTCAQCKRSLTTFEEECGLCNGEGVVTCEWDSTPTPCPKCQAGYEG